MDDVVAAELRPGTIAPGLRHEAIEGDVWSAAQLLEIRTRRNDELRYAVIVIGGEDVERVRVHVVEHVLAHDQGVPERAEICLQVGDWPPGLRIGQVKKEVTVQAGD